MWKAFVPSLSPCWLSCCALINYSTIISTVIIYILNLLAANPCYNFRLQSAYIFRIPYFDARTSILYTSSSLTIFIFIIWLWRFSLCSFFSLCMSVCAGCPCPFSPLVYADWPPRPPGLARPVPLSFACRILCGMHDNWTTGLGLKTALANPRPIRRYPSHVFPRTNSIVSKKIFSLLYSWCTLCCIFLRK